MINYNPLYSRHRQLGRPRDNYVYAWFDGRKLLYIGRGTAGRGLNWGFRAYDAERERREATAFRCVVLLDGMSRLEAARQEAAAIAACRPCYNVRHAA